MESERDIYHQAAGTVLSLMPRDRPPTLDELRETSAMVAEMYRKKGDGELNSERLALMLEHHVDVWDGDVEVLEDDADHVAWLPGRRGSISWTFWDRYKRWLELDRQFPPVVVGRLETSVDEVLARLEDPERAGAWDRRGMVVGQVQSGKTGHYTGLVCRAADAGYRLIVVLAGLHDSLRSQTQLRLDEGFLGFDTQRRMLDGRTVRIGVGRAQTRQTQPPAHALTNSANNGDFNLAIASRTNVNVHGSDPILLVVKKNTRILKNLTAWATGLGEYDEELGRKVVKGVPLLVIDDEADNASINTKKVPTDEAGQPLEEYEPSRTNERIRELLNAFERSAYVGYTATPFANVFISPEAETARLGKDLFPKSFIINIKPPSNYVGPSTIFGDGRDPDDRGMPEVIRDVADASDWIDDKLKNNQPPAPLPPSLQEALKAFVLTIAARRARGQRDHNSMLVHVTRYTQVQEWVTEAVRQELLDMRDRLDYGEGASQGSVRDEFKTLWKEDFEKSSRALEVEPDSWETINALLSDVVASIEVKTLNGTARDALEYLEHRELGLNVIAIGGDKLARGLTLEGLSVSYFLRASRMYDTLMQMGRWFGYRPGYLDLCRLYTPKELQRWYREITHASEELREEFDRMVRQGDTPENYGLRVRTHPDGLHITAPNKLRDTQVVQITYDGSITETIAFSRAEEPRKRNLDAAQALLQTCARGKSVRGNAIFNTADPEKILAFLGSIHTDPAAVKAQAQPIADYIRDRVRNGRLSNWTVAMISSGQGSEHEIVPGLTVGLTERADQSPDDPDRYTLRRLVSPPDEGLDLSRPEIEAALAATVAAWRGSVSSKKPDAREPTSPTGLALRERRSVTDGLLLLYPLVASDALALPYLGIAISFPFDRNAKPVKYRVNQVYWQAMLGDDA